jgi:hypothetical protein
MRLIWVMPIEGCAGSSRWRHVRLLKAVQMLAAREECPAPTSGLRRACERRRFSRPAHKQP